MHLKVSQDWGKWSVEFLDGAVMDLKENQETAAKLVKKFAADVRRRQSVHFTKTCDGFTAHLNFKVRVNTRRSMNQLRRRCESLSTTLTAIKEADQAKQVWNAPVEPVIVKPEQVVEVPTPEKKWLDYTVRRYKHKIIKCYEDGTFGGTAISPGGYEHIKGCASIEEAYDAISDALKRQEVAQLAKQRYILVDANGLTVSKKGYTRKMTKLSQKDLDAFSAHGHTGLQLKDILTGEIVVDSFKPRAYDPLRPPGRWSHERLERKHRHGR